MNAIGNSNRIIEISKKLPFKISYGNKIHEYMDIFILVA